MTKQEKRQLNEEAKRQKAEQKMQQKAEKRQQKQQLKQQKAEKRLQAKAEKQQKRAEMIAERNQSIEYKTYVLAKKQLDSNSNWYKLDNDAMLYPLISDSEGKSTFRLSATLNEPVDALALQQAVNDVIPRFPTMTSALKNGIFWPYLDKPTAPLVVTQQKALACHPMALDGKRGLVRVTYFGNEIAVEFFHSATDGTGGIVFLNTLLSRYFELIGYEIKDKTNCLDYRDKPRYDEITDNVPRIVDKNAKLNKQSMAKILKGNLLPDGLTVSRYGYCSASQLKSVANGMGATVTQLLTSAIMLACSEYVDFTMQRDNKPIVIMCPVNLRKVFGLDTLRNFTNYMLLTYHGGNIEETIADVKQQMQVQSDKQWFINSCSPNYFNSHIPVLKIAPLPLKKTVIKLVCKKRGSGKINSTTISNLGIVHAPEEFKQHVVRYDFLLGEENLPAIGFSCITYNDVCSINISDRMCQPIIEEKFFKKLAELGIDFAVEGDNVEGL